MRITFERALDDQEGANEMKMGCERWLARTPTTDKRLTTHDRYFIPFTNHGQSVTLPTYDLIDGNTAVKGMGNLSF